MPLNLTQKKTREDSNKALQIQNTSCTYRAHKSQSDFGSTKRNCIFLTKIIFTNILFLKKIIKEKDGQVSPYGNLVKSATEKLKNSKIESELSERVGFRKIYLVCS